MANAIRCNNFVQNAWKRDLCSNCFKSKEEHPKNEVAPVTTIILQAPKEGILKGSKTRTRSTKGNKVVFPSEVFEVIGYGGEECYSDDETYVDHPNIEPTTDHDDNEDDIAFQKLTKSNTDFNSVPQNLKDGKEGEVKKVVEPLKLGKAIKDDQGKKKTLLVSVTPFGAPSDSKPKSKITSLPIILNQKLKEPESVKDSPKKTETAHITSSLTRTDAQNVEKVNISTVSTDLVDGNKRMDDSQMTCKETKNEPLDKTGKADTAQLIQDSGKTNTLEKTIKRSQPLDKHSKYRPKESKAVEVIDNAQNVAELKDNAQESENKKTQELIENEKNLLKVEDIPNPEPRTIEMEVKHDKLTTSEKVLSLMEKAKKKVYPVPVSSEANVKLKTKETNIMSNKKNLLNVQTKSKDISLDLFNLRKEEKEEKAVEQCQPPPVLNVSSLHRTYKSVQCEAVKKTPCEQTEPKPKNAPSPTEVCTNTSVNIVPNIICNFSNTDKCESSNEVKEPVVNEQDDSKVKPTVLKNFPLVQKVAPFNINQIETESQEQESAQNIRNSFNSFENFENIMKGEEVTLFSAEESRKSVTTEGSIMNDIAKCEERKMSLLSKEAEEKVAKAAEVAEFSREAVGEPDGRADSDDLSEPPALPANPPPNVDARSSFLHTLTMLPLKKAIGSKPKVPVKPAMIPTRKSSFPTASSPPPVIEYTHPPLQESPSSDSIRTPKRQAPKPPSPTDDSPHPRCVDGLEDVDEPHDMLMVPQNVVVLSTFSPTPDGTPSPRVKINYDRRSKSSDNLLELTTHPLEMCPESVNVGVASIPVQCVPEPTPRRSMSLSQDSLLTSGVGEVQEKKKTHRGRFSLRKLLHLGKSKESNKEYSPVPISQDVLPPVPKPRLEIIHPCDLEGGRMEVMVPPVRPTKSRRTSSSASSSSGEQRESDVLSDSSASQSICSSGNDSQIASERPKKPPPPPRTQSLESWGKNMDVLGRPARPPPPKASDVQRHTTTWTSNVSTIESDGVYVNLGEARVGLAPNKPVRSASLRDVKAENTKHVAATTQPEDSGYESFDLSLNTRTTTSEDHVYEYVTRAEGGSLSPSPSKRNSSRHLLHRRSDGAVDSSTDYVKFRFLRSVSLPFCATESDSDIYSPYSFCGSEVGEDDTDLSPTSGRALRASRLKLKKGRSIVHKSLEDNYGAVIIANHEALAQVVEQMHQGPAPPPALRPLATLNLTWAEFTVVKEGGVTVGQRVFYPALWGIHGVTLCLIAEQGLHCGLLTKGSFSLNPVTEFCDLIPSEFLPILGDDRLVQASISVLTRLRIETLQTYGQTITSAPVTDDLKKESNFVLLQIINALKSLQAEGVEDAPMCLSNMILCREDRDPQPRLCLLQNVPRGGSGSPLGSLCQCAMIALTDYLPHTHLTPVLSDILRHEKAVSLSQAKSILEFSLWGPADIAFVSEREQALQRWLDLERATVLHGLVRTRAELTVFEEWHLVFLTRTSAKMLSEASVLVNSDVGVA